MLETSLYTCTHIVCKIIPRVVETASRVSRAVLTKSDFIRAKNIKQRCNGHDAITFVNVKDAIKNKIHSIQGRRRENSHVSHIWMTRRSGGDGKVCLKIATSENSSTSLASAPLSQGSPFHLSSSLAGRSIVTLAQLRVDTLTRA